MESHWVWGGWNRGVRGGGVHLQKVIETPGTPPLINLGVRGGLKRVMDPPREPWIRWGRGGKGWRGEVFRK